MAMRLGGYVRKRGFFSSTTVGQRVLLVAVILAAHLGLVFWWSTGGDAQSGSWVMREYVTYYEIAPLPAAGDGEGSTDEAAEDEPDAKTAAAGDDSPAEPSGTSTGAEEGARTQP